MRKSKRVSTILLFGGAAVALSACGEAEPEQKVNIFTTLEQCMAQRSKSDCESAFATAQKEHLATAPRFTTKAECEAEFGVGACAAPEAVAQAAGQPVAQATNGGGNFFMPFMMGYMLGDMMDRNSGSRYYSRPIYVDKYGYGYIGDRRVTQFRGGCQQGERCDRSGGAIIGSAVNSGGANGYTTSTRSSTLMTPSKPSSPSVISSSRSSGGFGATGARASSGGS